MYVFVCFFAVLAVNAIHVNISIVFQHSFVRDNDVVHRNVIG